MVDVLSLVERAAKAVLRFAERVGDTVTETFRCETDYEDVPPTRQATTETDAVTAAIRDTLSDHAFWHANHASIGGNPHCLCGERPRTEVAWREHVAPLITKSIQEIPYQK